ncbi:sulfurtransferase [Verticiella sediminum]|uniref:Sulfurtransferase n=1 Tax=Verticiella sediminum TaxID=1247510 RepID=A0A556AIY9_9BURK|nr:sulfurtransferase [Verticiella sediminum]TSH92868.1 sulfurtransferase [Verticiella sediminum]
MSSPLIDCSTLAARLGRDNVRVFDVRHDLARPGAGFQAYREARIPGAIFLDVETDLSGARTSTNGRHPLPARAAFRQRMVEAGVGEDDLVVAYDAQGGAMAARLWWMMRWIGHAQAAVLDGGWPAWLAQGLPVDDAPLDEQRASSGAAASPLHLNEPLVGSVSADEVAANLERPEFLVLDARAHARYLGEVEPLDPVAGHIPGALNRPHTENLAQDGRFKPAQALREEFAALLGERAPHQVVHQCGSGITACHNLLAMEHAGLTGSRLYPGSWSEWCADPLRPVA